MKEVYSLGLHQDQSKSVNVMLKSDHIGYHLKNKRDSVDRWWVTTCTMSDMSVLCNVVVISVL